MSKKKLNSNALKRLGLDAPSLLDNCFSQPQLQGCLNAKEYTMFWDQIHENAQNGTDFLVTMIQKLKKALSMKSRGAQSIPVETLVTTISFISMICSVKASDSRLGRALKDFSKDFSPDDKKMTAEIKQILRVVNQLVDGTNMIGSIIVGCITLHSHQEFQKMGSIVHFPTLNDAEEVKRSGESCFFYQHLKIAVQDKERSAEVLKSCVDKMHSLPQQMKMNPRLAETTLLALLHMVTQFISTRPITDAKFLQYAMTTIQPFYLWPCPSGNVTRATLQMIQREMSLPGDLMHSYLKRDCLRAAALTGQESGARAIYYIMNQSSSSGALSRILQLTHRSQNEKKLHLNKQNTNSARSPRLQTSTVALLMCNMLVVDQVSDGQGAYEALNTLSANTIMEIYNTLEAQFEPIRNGPPGQDHANQRLAALRTMQSSILTATPSGSLLGLPSPPPAHFAPPSLPVTHIGADCDMSYKIESAEVLSLMLLSYVPYPLTPVFGELEVIISSYATAPKPCEIPICIAGGDELLHNFLCAYMRLQQMHSEWLKGITIKLMILPWAKNGLAAFLARHDSWYHRHVYIPFRSKAFLLPWVQGEEKTQAGKKEEEEDITPLCQYFRDTILSYSRESNQTCDINVYKVEGWLESDANQEKKGNPDQCLPFCQHVELGRAAAVQSFRERRGLSPDQITNKDIISNKNFQYDAPALNVGIRKMDLSGELQKTVQDDNVSFNSISVSNVPQVGDACFPPDPTCPWLEMHCVPTAKSQQRVTSLLVSDPSQHIGKLTVQCVNVTHTFEILVDGQVFGPFWKIKISRATYRPPGSDKEAPFTLPVQTFFPLDV